MKRHGYSATLIYRIWASMKQRCNNPKSNGYKYYGARGIKMCDEWNNNPKLFIDYVSNLINYRKKDYSLDRIDSSVNYEPGNVRWSPRIIQVRNRNTKSGNSGYDGIRIKKFTRDRYIARITVDYEGVYIGTYDTAYNAAKARDQYIIDNNLEGFKIQVL